MRVFASAAALLAVLCSLFLAHASTDIYICQSDDPKLLGKYSATRENLDSAPIYSNANDMSFFRNKGFWYIGDLQPWPPVTHYRCVEHEGCSFGEKAPPISDTDGWKASKKFDKGTKPVISYEPCSGVGEEL
ncbi:hypothetical protein B484DRAFT_444318 [Ochromonadaceae sp. CCMP2298]|nr:hypothetical protein B484DRAFT_444318 [Ochromonadaceae sp. CCMP2298]